MAQDKKLKLDTLSQTSKKKKDVLIFVGVAFILALVAFSIFSFSLDVDEEKVYKKRNEESLNKSDLKLTPKENIKEAWAMSVENTFKEQNKVLIQFMKDVKETRKENQKELVGMIEESQKDTEGRLLEMSEKLDREIKKMNTSLSEAVLKQDNRIEEIKINTAKGANVNIVNSNPEEEIVLGDDLIPQIDPNRKIDATLNSILGDPVKDENKIENKTDNKETLKDPFGNIIEVNRGGGKGPATFTEPTKEKEKKVSLFKINTEDVKQYILDEKEKELKEIKDRIKEKNSYHIMVGLTKAYLVSGVYAPAFSEGKSDPLPVLLQAEGDILIANNDTENVENCFFIGSAKGNINSQTADIRLNKISCSLADGTKKIEGTISGWVIGENGIPGVPGELLHKNGAWLAKTFVAGFLETFSSSVVAYSGANRTGATTGTDVNIGDTVGTSAASSTSDVFSKIGQYYLKMAQQIFPVIEVKPGRTVDILLKGGETLTVTDFNSAEITAIENDIAQLKAEQEEEDKERLKELEAFKEMKASQDKPLVSKSGQKNNDLFAD